MEITIHRGTHEIGGTCIQINSGGRSILLDAGAPLGQSMSHVDLTNLNFTDLFVSHPHQDHYGLIDSVAPSQTVHIGAMGKKLIDTTKIFLGGKPLEKTFNFLINRKPVDLGGSFTVTPYLMDHSCVDAFGFLVEAEGKRVYYSGDFRAHGRRDKAFKWFLAEPPENVDVLLMEGTMMGRDNIKTPSETAVEDKIAQVLKESDLPCMLISSGQHIDRLCAAFCACKRAGRTLVLDMYTASVLRVVSNQIPSVPDINKTDRIKVLVTGGPSSSHYKKLSANRSFFGKFANDIFAESTAIRLEELLQDPSKYLIKVSRPLDIIKLMDRCNVVYSMWEGYLKDGQYEQIENHPKVIFHKIHTSGHATRNDLKRFAAAIKPKLLIPVHTEKPNDYEKTFTGHTVSLLIDGCTITI